MTLLRAPYTATEVVMFFVAAVIYIASYQFFARTATPKFGPKKEVLDPGLDLNMAQGRAFMMAWRSVISPWLFAPAPEETEMDAKKQK